ncbi:hypothetical protein BT96DRAFT_998956 [Gymnopus androsaceus JB14]|uniref:Uncharacterized protein n=1 Tax=Gymnopus androsaceus JB14 TaxID=1447944 RepID=A0A6A4H9V5_9AGAR|nr:hypothetical protein BT96DRAFT_998956 [Gymnopus androsaceus JB14]
MLHCYTTASPLWRKDDEGKTVYFTSTLSGASHTSTSHSYVARASPNRETGNATFCAASVSFTIINVPPNSTSISFTTNIVFYGNGSDNGFGKVISKSITVDQVPRYLSQPSNSLISTWTFNSTSHSSDSPSSSQQPEPVSSLAAGYLTSTILSRLSFFPGCVHATLQAALARLLHPMVQRTMPFLHSRMSQQLMIVPILLPRAFQPPVSEPSEELLAAASGSSFSGQPAAFIREQLESLGPRLLRTVAGVTAEPENTSLASLPKTESFNTSDADDSGANVESDKESSDLVDLMSTTTLSSAPPIQEPKQVKPPKLKGVKASSFARSMTPHPSLTVCTTNNSMSTHIPSATVTSINTPLVKVNGVGGTALNTVLV